MTRRVGTAVQILSKFVVIPCHRAERPPEGIIEGRFGELSYFLCPRATVGSCVHASQTVSLAARFREKVGGHTPVENSDATLPGSEPFAFQR